MSDTIVVPLEDIKTAAEKYPGSYFAGAVSFAEACGHSEIEICWDGARYMHLADTTGLIECMDKFTISPAAMATNLLKCMLELNKNSLKIVKTYIPEMIRLRMYEEFQKYVFSQIDKKEMIKLYICYRFDIEFLTAYPYRNKNNSTMLMCFVGIENIAIQILKSGGNPEHININGNTAFILACAEHRSNVAAAILATGNAKPEQINCKSNTALIWACKKELTDIAMAILATESAGKPEQVNDDSNTALIWACKNGMEDVALAILATGPGGVGGGNPDHENEDGKTALDYAHENDLDGVVAALEALDTNNEDS